MPYIATQRCSSCHGSNTTVRIEYAERKSVARDPDAKSVWHCADCLRDFSPSDVTVMEPILMCKLCLVPTPHKFLREEKRQYQPLLPNEKQPVHHIMSHIYACECKTERVFGCHSAP